MDRFVWSDGQLYNEEQMIAQQSGVRIYDGSHKTAYDCGTLTLTSHRFLWKDQKDPKCQLALSLSYISKTDEEPTTFTKKAKIVLDLKSKETSQGKNAGPVAKSPFNFIRFSFQDGGEKDMFRHLGDTLSRRRWDVIPLTPVHQEPIKQYRSGIGGIEKGILKKNAETDKSISVAFEDMSNLMDKAKDMVQLSSNISAKIKDKQGDISEDETIQFKAHLLSLGIDDPVTRETHGSGSTYYTELAKQVSDVMLQPLTESGKPITLTDAYCRVNRARGMEMLSPEDLVNACKLMEELNLPVVMKKFDSGVMVLQLKSQSDNIVIHETSKAVESAGSMTADELSRLAGLPVILSKERLLAAEKSGKLCRDETTEGLRFYPNRFVSNSS